MNRLSGSSPFRGTNPNAILEENYKCNVKYLNHLWHDISLEARILVDSMLNPRPSKRISAKQALNSLFLKNSSLKQKNYDKNSNEDYEAFNHIESALSGEIISSLLEKQSKITHINLSETASSQLRYVNKQINPIENALNAKTIRSLLEEQSKNTDINLTPSQLRNMDIQSMEIPLELGDKEILGDQFKSYISQEINNLSNK